MIVLIGGTKGGTGKSTLATNLAAYLAVSGVDFILVDCDDPKQASSAKWAARREENPSLPHVQSVQKTGNVYQSLCDQAERYKVVLVDAGGSDSKELRTAMAAAHKLIVPLQASQFDLESLPELVRMINEVRDVLNPNLIVSAVLTKAPSNPNGREIPDARVLLEDFPEITLSSEVVRDRVTYRDAIRDGRGVVELNNSVAKAEIQLLAEEIFGNELNN